MYEYADANFPNLILSAFRLLELLFLIRIEVEVQQFIASLKELSDDHRESVLGLKNCSCLDLATKLNESASQKQDFELMARLMSSFSEENVVFEVDQRELVSAYSAILDVVKGGAPKDPRRLSLRRLLSKKTIAQNQKSQVLGLKKHAKPPILKQEDPDTFLLTPIKAAHRQPDLTTTEKPTLQELLPKSQNSYAMVGNSDIGPSRATHSNKVETVDEDSLSELYQLVISSFLSLMSTVLSDKTNQDSLTFAAEMIKATEEPEKCYFRDTALEYFLQRSNHTQKTILRIAELPIVFPSQQQTVKEVFRIKEQMVDLCCQFGQWYQRAASVQERQLAARIEGLLEILILVKLDISMDDLEDYEDEDATDFFNIDERTHGTVFPNYLPHHFFNTICTVFWSKISARNQDLVRFSGILDVCCKILSMLFDSNAQRKAEGASFLNCRLIEKLILFLTVAIKGNQKSCEYIVPKLLFIFQHADQLQAGSSLMEDFVPNLYNHYALLQIAMTEVVLPHSPSFLAKTLIDFAESKIGALSGFDYRKSMLLGSLIINNIDVNDIKTRAFQHELLERIGSSQSKCLPIAFDDSYLDKFLHPE